MEEQGEIPVVVAVMIRPLIYDEMVQGCKDSLVVYEGEAQVCCGSHNYKFDYVYGGGGSSPGRLFPDCVAPLVDGVFKGYNATVLAYGQTGSGKTYTMGSQYTPNVKPKGVIPDVLVGMFNRMFNQSKSEFALRVGFIEIHKEEINDLLLAPGQAAPSINIREMPNGSMVITGAREVEINLEYGAERALEQVMDILMKGTMARATSMTMMNARSSRSHAVFSLNLEQRLVADPGADVKPEELDLSYLCAKMMMVDLAGSERVKRTQATGARLQEGIHINQGLLSLANVIQALVDGHKHVPYRNSKLTRLLQDSLGHNSRTVMVACVSPADSNVEETMNTLRYASRARNIKNKPIVNRDPNAAEILLLRQQLSAARAEIVALRNQVGGKPGARPSAHLVEELEERITIYQKQLGECTARLSEVLADREAHELSAVPDSALIGRLQLYQARILELEAALDATSVLSRRGTAEAPMLSPHYHGGSVPSVFMASFEADGEDGYQDMLSAARKGGEYSNDMNTTPRSLSASEMAYFNASEQQKEEASMMQQLSSLQADLRKKEMQVQKLVGGAEVDSMRAQYESMMHDLLREKEQLKARQMALQKKLDAAGSLHAAEREKQMKIYKKQRKELDQQVAKLKQREQEKTKLETVMKKSEDMVSKLQHEISRIKTEKVGLMKQIAGLQHDYAAFKRGKAKEITSLKKDSKKAENEMRRLVALNEKQKAVLQRKIQEAEDAKKRLANIKSRSRTAPRPTNSTVANGASAALPPLARSASAATAGGGGSSHIPQAPERGATMDLAHTDVLAHGVPAAAKDGPKGVDAGPGEPDGAQWGADHRGHQAVPEMGNPKAMMEWIRDEIDAASTVHDTRVVLKGTVAKRSDLAKKAEDLKRRMTELDSLPPAQQEQYSGLRRELATQLQGVEEEVEQCTKSITALNTDLDAAEQQNDESRIDSHKSRFSAFTNLGDAQQLLGVLFQMACSSNDEVILCKAVNSDLEDEKEMLKDKLEAALHDLEQAQNEVHALQRNAARVDRSAADSGFASPGRASEAGSEENAESAALPQRPPLPAPPAKLRVNMQIASMMLTAQPGAAVPVPAAAPAAPTAPAPVPAAVGPSHVQDASVDGGVSAPSAVSYSSPPSGGIMRGMPPIQENEEFRAREAPDITQLDQQYQELMNEINGAYRSLAAVRPVEGAMRAAGARAAADDDDDEAEDFEEEGGPEGGVYDRLQQLRPNSDEQEGEDGAVASSQITSGSHSTPRVFTLNSTVDVIGFADQADLSAAGQALIDESAGGDGRGPRLWHHEPLDESGGSEQLPAFSARSESSSAAQSFTAWRLDTLPGVAGGGDRGGGVADGEAGQGPPAAQEAPRGADTLNDHPLVEYASKEVAAGGRAQEAPVTHTFHKSAWPASGDDQNNAWFLEMERQLGVVQAQQMLEADRASRNRAAQVVRHGMGGQ